MYWRFEQRHQPLLTRQRFLLRMLAFAFLALAIDALAILLGMLGFHVIGELQWLDSAVDAAMIMTGNGPLYPLDTTVGKVFQLCYALLGGIVFVVLASVVLAPVLHRILHAFNIKVQDMPPPQEE